MSIHRNMATAAIQALLLCVSPIATASADPLHSLVIRADEVEWKPGPAILQGVQMAVLRGSPTEAGPFVMRLRFPAFFDYPVHRHPGTEGNITVLSGGMGMAMGETFDRYVNRPLPAGSFFVMPDAWHFAWTFEETVVEVQGNGPWRVEFLDP